MNKRMETSHENVYAAGDVVGGIMSTPVSRMEGVVAARNACEIFAEADYRFIPHSISLQYDVGFISSKTMRELKVTCQDLQVPEHSGAYLKAKQDSQKQSLMLKPVK